MVFIYRKIVGNKEYYYLRASVRKGSKVVTKDIVYLGSDAYKIKERLDSLSPKYAKEIRKSYKNISKFIESNYYFHKVKKSKLKTNKYFDNNTLEEIEACKLHWIKEFQKQNENTKQESLQDFLVEFAHNSTGIEGNTISLNEAQNLLIENQTPKDKTLREVYDLKNTQKEFFELLKKPSKKITLKFISKVHNNLLKEIDSRTGYREKDVRLRKVRFKSTPASYVLTDMKILLDWFKKNEKKLHPFVLAIIFHHKLEKIHPFMDGNGRTGRIVMNYILMQKKYPPLIIRKKNRLQYLKKLNEADKSFLTNIDVKHYKELIKFASKELTENYWNIFL